MFSLTMIQSLQEWLTAWLGDTPRAQLIANAIMVVVTVVLFWLVYLVVFRIFNKLSQRVLKEDSQVQPLRIQKQEILSAPEVAAILNLTIQILSWILRIYLLLVFLNTVFGLFNWSRDLSESLASRFADVVGSVVGSFVNYIPNLITIVVIVAISYGIVKLIRLIFDGIARQRIKFPGFYPEWSRTSFGLLRMLIIAMTIVVVFPYLPGSDSPAFQGVSIFVGVLLSLGSTSAVANVVAGIVITYTRAFRKGDWVSVAGAEGKIVERTAFVTRIRTAKNVDISVPNASVLSDKVINFSTQARNTGIALHTGVTIGYDVPWPKVQELLLSAARKTEHIEEQPAPFVLQTALDDNYVASELNAFTKKAGIRPRIFSDLHANILDSFHAAGVEITSPHDRAMRDGNEAAMAEVIVPEPGEETKPAE